MKKLNYIILGLLGLLSANVSCDSPKEDNAIYNEPTSFVLNTPAYADAVYDLKNSSNSSSPIGSGVEMFSLAIMLEAR